jgi:hypothetical protein
MVSFSGLTWLSKNRFLLVEFITSDTERAFYTAADEGNHAGSYQGIPCLDDKVKNVG